MKVGELIKQLAPFGVDTEVVISSDEEGNSFADHIEVARHEGDKRAFLYPLNSKVSEDFLED